jgi:hypothetical protein
MLAFAKNLLGSKKFVAMIVGVISMLVAKIGWDVDDETITKVVALVASYVVGQGIADNGKEAAKVKAS